MNLEGLLSQLREAILPILEGQGLELVEMKFITAPARPILRLLVDRKEGGVSLGDCSRVNTLIGKMLDETSLLQERYILEVSSPGLDRPLVTPRDYARCINRRVRLFLSEPVKEKIEIEAEIKESNEDSVVVETGGERLEIPLAKVQRAKQIIE